MPLSLISFPHMTVQFFSHFQGPGSLVRPNEVIPRQPSGRANGSGVSTSCPDCLAVRRYPTCQRLKAIRPTSCRWKYVWIHGGGSQNGDTPKSSKIGCFQWENQGFGVPIFFRKPSCGCSPLHAALLTGASHWFILTFPATWCTRSLLSPLSVCVPKHWFRDSVCQYGVNIQQYYTDNIWKSHYDYGYKSEIKINLHL